MTDEQIAAAANIPVAVLRAIRATESSGNPGAVRFEPHLFLRHVPGAQIPYTPGPTQAASRVRAETNRAAFEQASRINREAAIRSTSWGLYQVLGEHLLRSFPSRPVEYFDADPMGASERMLISWFQSRPPAAAAARAHNIPELARMYNGSATSPWAGRVAAALARGDMGIVRGVAVRVAVGRALDSDTAWLVAGVSGMVVLSAVAAWATRRR